MLDGNVLLTGGSGFLGRAILRRAEQENWPARFTVYSRDETKQWELNRRYPNVRCVLGDVARDLDRLISVCNGHDTVIHMGAVKYIPEAEHNVLETIDVNINGSRNVGIASIAAQVKTVIGISTDKACSPANVYGMTKAIMERMFSEFSLMSKTRFVTVRYGNVVGSTGSVIPVFQRHIKDWDQIRVTDSRMSRFWLSVNEAINLILTAYNRAETDSGRIFISNCPSMKIKDLAETVWSMERKDEPNIMYTGIRPGEKLHEALFNEQEAPRVIVEKDLFIMRPAIETGDPSPKMMMYESSHPSHWVTIPEMQEMIKNAASV